jgi:hypothetical protein
MGLFCGTPNLLGVREKEFPEGANMRPPGGVYCSFGVTENEPEFEICELGQIG